MRIRIEPAVGCGEQGVRRVPLPALSVSRVRQQVGVIVTGLCGIVDHQQGRAEPVHRVGRSAEIIGKPYDLDQVLLAVRRVLPSI